MSGAEEKGWFDVQAYSTRERWVGPDSHDGGLDGFESVDDAIEAAKGESLADYYEVIVVAYGDHVAYERGETVFKLRDRPTEAGYNAECVRAAEAALKNHKEVLKIEGDDSTQLWHLLVSLREWAAASGVDFDEELRDVEACVLKGELNLTLAAEALRKRNTKAGPQGSSR